MAIAERELTVMPVVHSASSEPRPLRWTREQYYQLAEAGLFGSKRVELMEGEILEMPPMGYPHRTAVGLAVKALMQAFPAGYFVLSQSPMTFGAASDPEPDAMVVPGELRDYTDAPINQVSLILEVSATTLEYDRTRKAAIYAQYGVLDYWIVNLEDDQIEVRRVPKQMRNGDYGYTELKIYERGEILRPLADSGVSIRVDDLLL